MAAQHALNTCFFVTPIGDPESAARSRADIVLNHILKPALTPDLVADVTRVDLAPRAGFITSTVIEHIVRSRLVVADITGLNPNVFYELAIAHAARKPVITIREPDATIPFDISALNAIECGLDLAGGTTAIGQVRAAAERLLAAESEIESPVKTALLLLNADKSEGGQRSLEAEILRRLDGLESGIARSLVQAQRLGELDRPLGSLASPFDDMTAVSYELERLRILISDRLRSGASGTEVDELVRQRDYLLRTLEHWSEGGSPGSRPRKGGRLPDGKSHQNDRNA